MFAHDQEYIAYNSAYSSYRGNYDKFVTLYELKFPNGCKLDSKGRVIIER